MRWPTTSISEGLAMIRVLPLHSVFSECLIASPCELAGIFSSRDSPWAVVILSVPSAPCPTTSASAAHNGAGGCSGKLSCTSYRRLFWLLEPAFSTNIFIHNPFFNQTTPSLAPRACLQSLFAHTYDAWQACRCTPELMVQ